MQVTGIGLRSAKADVAEPYGFSFDYYFVAAGDAVASNTTAQAVISIWRVPSGIHVYHHLSFSLSYYLVVKMRYTLGTV